MDDGPRPIATRGTLSSWVTYGVLLGGAILLVVLIFGALWRPLFLAAVLAGALSRLHDRLARRFKGRRVLSATLFTLGVVLLVLIPLVSLSVIAVQQTLQAADFIRKTLESGGVEALLGPVPDWLRPALAWLLDVVRARATDLAGQAASGGRLAVTVVSGAVSATTGFLFQGVMMLIAFQALLMDGASLVDWSTETIPLGGRRVSAILREFRDVSSTVLGSMVATAAVQALAASFGYVLAGIPQPVFFGLLTFLASFVPSVGTALVAVPLGVLTILAGRSVQGALLLVWTSLVVGLIDNVLRPLLVRGGLRLNGVVVLFALLGGVAFLGPVGLIAGPLSLTFFLTMVRLGQSDFRLAPSGDPAASACDGERQCSGNGTARKGDSSPGGAGAGSIGPK